MSEPRVRLRPEIAALPAYRQGRAAAPEGYKLSSNENPYAPHPAVLAAIADVEINRYPEATARALRERLAERHGVTPEHVQVGAGSVSLLAQFIAAAATVGDEVVHAWRSFEAYPSLVTVAGATRVQIPNLPDGRHDLDAMAAAVGEATRVVLVCSPNNPTGPIVTRDELAVFLDRVPPTVLVLLDEAYREFVTDPRVPDGLALQREHPNLVVLRTFSKAYGLAGLRIGYAIGEQYLVDAARSTAIPLSVIEHAQRAALAALDHEQELLERVAEIAERRDRVRAALLDQGWAVPEAQGNFVWLPTGERTEHAAEEFAAEGLVVRAFPPDGIRITIAEEESVEHLVRIAGRLAPAHH